jgi:hypothetical protein
MTTLTALKKIRKLLEDPSRWTKGSYHKRDYGVDSYCLMGAKKAVCDLDLYHLFGDWPINFNDDPDTTHNDILMFLDNCIMDEKLRNAR